MKRLESLDGEISIVAFAFLVFDKAPNAGNDHNGWQERQVVVGEPENEQRRKKENPCIYKWKPQAEPVLFNSARDNMV